MWNLPDLSRIKGFRFLRAVIGYAVWAYHQCALSLRNVEDLLASCGIRVSYETVRDWVARFGGQFAGRIRCERPGPADKWHLDEVAISIKGKKHWLWRTVDANGLSRQIPSRSPAGQWMCWMSWFSRVGTRAQPSTSFESCSGDGAAARAGRGQARFLGRGQGRDAPGIEHR